VAVTPRRARPWHYLLAVALVAAVYFAQSALRPLIGPDVPVVIMLALAVVAAAWAGGVGPGLLATLLALVAAQRLSLKPDTEVAISASGYALRVVMFGLLGILISALSELRRKAVAHVEASAETVATEVRARRDAEERFRRIVETAMEGVWEVDAEGRTVYANRRLEEMFGYGAGEMMGLRALDLVAPGGEEEALAEWEKRRRGVANAGSDGELEMRRKDGSTFWIQSTATPMHDADRTFVGACAMVTDATSRREAERALHAGEARRITELEVVRVRATLEEAYPRLLETIGKGLHWDTGALWLVDTDANALRCASLWRQESIGPEFASVTSRLTFSPGVGLPGRVWTSGEAAWVSDVSADRNFPRELTAAESGLNTGFAFPVLIGSECIGVADFYCRRRRPVEPDVVEGASAIGSQIGLFVNRKRGEEERGIILQREQLARQEAEAANRAKDEFLATLSHELRTPLNAIVGWAHLLRTGQLDAGAAGRAIAVIDRNARAQSQIIADVLDVSKIVMGKLRLAVGPVAMAPVVDSAIEALRPAADAKGVRIETAFDPNEALVSGDADRLRQVAWNLLSNAVKFTPQGGRVLVQIRRTGSHVELRVEDTGAGVPSEFLPHVFERFRQSDQSTTRRHGGLGLGLALVRHLVELHGGSVSASSAGENKGAAFAVRLPLMMAPAAKLKASSAATATPMAAAVPPAATTTAKSQAAMPATAIPAAAPPAAPAATAVEIGPDDTPLARES
jgi:PAS domain S-box-containing protein